MSYLFSGPHLDQSLMSLSFIVMNHSLLICDIITHKSTSNSAQYYQNWMNSTSRHKNVTRKVADRPRGRFGDCSGIIGFTYIKKKNNSLLALMRATSRDSLQTSDQWTKKKQKRLSFSSGDGLENRFGLL